MLAVTTCRRSRLAGRFCPVFTAAFLFYPRPASHIGGYKYIIVPFWGKVNHFLKIIFSMPILGALCSNTGLLMYNNIYGGAVMSVFSNRLISLRKERGLSQEDIGKLINKKRSTVSGYETEGKEPDIDTLCFLANYFGVSTDYLMGKSDKRNNVDTVFLNDVQNFKKHYEAAPDNVRKHTERCFDAFYRLLGRDVQLKRTERLEVYNELFNKMASLRAQISRSIAFSNGAITDPVALSELMAMQSELKNDVSALLDKLMQADMEVAFDLSTKEGANEAV